MKFVKEPVNRDPEPNKVQWKPSSLAATIGWDWYKNVNIQGFPGNPSTICIRINSTMHWLGLKRKCNIVLRKSYKRPEAISSFWLRLSVFNMYKHNKISTYKFTFEDKRNASNGLNFLKACSISPLPTPTSLSLVSSGSPTGRERIQPYIRHPPPSPWWSFSQLMSKTGQLSCIGFLPRDTPASEG
ncbi:hypothetical protein J6590_017746 [Homalodisca vitripennis]|nr:hypothetical protein J6590_017746 [Homalodisca vitripennis]